MSRWRHDKETRERTIIDLKHDTDKIEDKRNTRQGNTSEDKRPKEKSTEENKQEETQKKTTRLDEHKETKEKTKRKLKTEEYTGK